MELTIWVAVGVALFGIFVGLLSALFGIGGGLVMVPFIVLLLDRSQHLAEGTSLLVIVPTAVAGVVAHSKRGYVDFRAGALLGLGGVVGAFFGARVALASANDTLRIVFAGFLVVMGARLIVDGLRPGKALPVAEP